MDLYVAEDLPAWGHFLHTQEALLEFIAFMEAQNIDCSDAEASEQVSEWPFSEFPQVSAVQDMYRPEPKQMPMLCFNCGQTGTLYAFAAY